MTIIFLQDFKPRESTTWDYTPTFLGTYPFCGGFGSGFGNLSVEALGTLSFWEHFSMDATIIEHPGLVHN